MINRGLQSINLVLICFLKGFVEALNNNLYCAAADLHLLVNNNALTQYTIRQLYSNKTLVKSIYLGVQHRLLKLLTLHNVINL